MENPKGTLKAGTPVHATITGRTAANALLVPLEAVQTGPGWRKQICFGHQADGTPPSGGDAGHPNLRISADSQWPHAADTVITTGGYGLDDGTKVKVGTAPAEAGGEKE